MAKKVRDAMSGTVRTASLSQTLHQVARVMKDEDVGSLPVVEDGSLVGVVTDRDIVVRAVAEGRDPDTVTVGEVLSRDPVTIEPDQTLDQALQLMAQHQVRRLPVVDGGELVGVVAQADVAQKASEKETGELVEE